MAGVSVDYDRSADFPRFKTFAFKEGTPADNPFVQERIEAAIRRELEAKGLSMIDGDADLNVVTHAAVTTQTRVDVSGYGGGQWRKRFLLDLEREHDREHPQR